MKLMRPLLLSLGLAVCAASGLPGCGSGEEEPVDSGEERVLGPVRPEQARIVLDQVPFGEKVYGRFVVKNHSDEPQIISRIGPVSCGCTTLHLSYPERVGTASIELTGSRQDLELAPGETVHVEVEYDSSRKRRPVSRGTDSFALMVEGQPGEVLEYAVDVWTPFWVEPWSQDLGKIGVRERPSVFVSVKEHDTQSFSLILPEEVDGWTVRVEAAPTAAASYIVHFDAPEELPFGPFQLLVPVRTNLANSPEIEVSVTGVVVGDLDWGPKRASLFPAADGSAKQKFWLASRAPERPLALRNVILEGFPESYSVESLRVHPTTVEAERSYSIEIEMLQAPPQLLEGNLVLITDDENQPRIRIPLTIRPTP